MPQPQEAGRVTDTDSHALFLSTNANEVSPAAYEHILTNTIYISKEQRIGITNFLKWLSVDLNVELSETIFNDYTSGIGSTMHEGINNKILESLPIEVKIDIINKLFLSFGKIRDLSILLKLSKLTHSLHTPPILFLTKNLGYFVVPNP